MAARSLVRTALAAVLIAAPAHAQQHGPAAVPGRVVSASGRVRQPPGAPAVEREALVMGTRFRVRVWGPKPRARSAVESALAAVRSEEDRLSTWRADTELSRVNAAAAGTAVVVSPALLEVLDEVGDWVERTGGAFDPAVGALVDAWGLRGTGAVPGRRELAAALRNTGWEGVHVDAATGTVLRDAAGLWIDAGGFGKGLALRRAEAELRRRGIEGVLDFGGQILVVGDAGVAVEVAAPDDRSRSIARLRVGNASVATTGASERWIEVDGERFGHVLDPRSGQPVRPWGSVTVVTGDPMEADILSTALFVMGPEAALEWAKDRGYGVLVVESGPDGVRPRWNPAMERWLEAAWLDSTSASATERHGSVPQDTSELERLKRQVEAITRELERLRLGGEVAAEADTGVLGFGPAASKVYKAHRGVSIGGYGEVLYRWFSDELENGTEAPVANTWDALRAIVYFGYKFNDRLLFNSEVEVEHGDEAALEFAYLDYRLSDAFGLRGGLLLAPVGLLNELHEPPAFLGTTRPLVEQRLIPTTWSENGIGVFGDVGPLSYRAYVMNGLDASGFSAAGLRGGRQGGSHALAEDLAGAARVDYVGVPGLLAGGSVYYGGADQEQFEQDVTTLIWEGHASYQAAGLDLRALVAGANLEGTGSLSQALDLSGEEAVARRLAGGYAQVGYDILRSLDTGHQLLPYVRYEWLDTQAEVLSVPGFEANPANEATALLLGAAWKPVPNVAVKADYQIHGNDAETGRNEFAVVLSYLF